MNTKYWRMPQTKKYYVQTSPFKATTVIQKVSKTLSHLIVKIMKFRIISYHRTLNASWPL